MIAFNDTNDFAAVDDAIRQLSELQAKISELEEKAEICKKRQIDLIDAWLQSETEPIKQQMAVLNEIVKSYVEQQTKDTDKKSISFPHGRAGFKSVQPVFFFGDEKACKDNGALLDYVDKCGDSQFVNSKTIRTVDWLNLKKTLHFTPDGKVVNSDGEFIDNMHVEFQPDEFYVKTK